MPNLVQDASGNANPAPTLAITPAAAFVAGHGLTLCFDVNLAGGLSAVESDNGDVWQRIAQALETASSNPLAAELWYCKSSTGGQPTITVTASASGATITAWDMTEWDAAFGDVTQAQTGGDATGAWALGQVVAGAEDLTLFTMCNNDKSATNSPPPGFTDLVGNGSGNYVGYIEFGYLAGAGTTNAGGTVGIDGWAAAIAVLPPPATPPPPAPVVPSFDDDASGWVRKRAIMGL